jgi:hypothetical protein
MRGVTMERARRYDMSDVLTVPLGASRSAGFAVLQNVILYFTTYIWKWPGNAAILGNSNDRFQTSLERRHDREEQVQSTGGFMRASRARKTDRIHRTNCHKLFPIRASKRAEARVYAASAFDK